MKIFLAYGYNDRDRWINDLVAPIIEAFGAEVVDGKEMYGETLSEGVRKNIQSCDGLIAFLTRRDPGPTNNRWTTHRWVTDELACALTSTSKIHVLEVRETEIDDQGGMAGGRQYIVYDEKDRDRCLVDLVRAIGAWCRMVKVKLLPEDFVNEVRPVIKDPRVKCSYRYLDGSRTSAPVDVQMLPVARSLVIEVNNVPYGQPLIQVEVTAPGKLWTSDFEPVGLLSVHLQGG